MHGLMRVVHCLQLVFLAPRVGVLGCSWRHVLSRVGVADDRRHTV